MASPADPVDPGRPEFVAPGFAACYRHPDRSTGIHCQRCGKPICSECMRPASVGFQCPRCVSSARTSVRQPRTAFGASLRTRAGAMTQLLIAAVVGIWLVNFVLRGLLLDQLVLSNYAVATGQPWRLVTYGLTSAGLLHVGMTALVLWIAGRPLEHVLGGWRFLALFGLSGIGGATLLFALAPVTFVAVGASAAAIGLLAANGVLKLRQHQDVRPDVGLLILLVLYSFVVGWGSYNWLGQVGGIAVGALVGFVLAYAPRSRRTLLQTVGMLGVLALCGVVVVLRIASLT